MTGTAVHHRMPAGGEQGVAGRTPFPVACLYVLLALGYVIYIPVALFRTNAFLTIQDALVLLAVSSTLVVPSIRRRAFGGSVLVAVSALVFVASLIPAALLDVAGPSLSTVQGLRSLLFGVLVLLLSSVWINTPHRVDVVLKLMLVGSFVAVLYGLRQLLFGLLPFEQERIALMGASFGELEAFNRLRVPSTFGDPASYSFAVMLGVVVYLAARERGIFPLLTRWAHPWSVVLLVFGLSVSLTRAPMLGLAAALGIRYFVTRRWAMRRIFGLLGLGVLLAALSLAIDWLVTSGVLARTEGAWQSIANNVLSSVWTLLPTFTNDDVSSQLQALRTTSSAARSDAWLEGLHFLATNPFGGGVGSMTTGGLGSISFSPVDVGFLRYGLEAGWFGLGGMVGMFGGVAVAAWCKIRRPVDASTRRLGVNLLALWLGIGIGVGITSFLHTEVLSLMVWTLGGIMLNLDQISNRRQEAFDLKGVMH